MIVAHRAARSSTVAVIVRLALRRGRIRGQRQGGPGVQGAVVEGVLPRRDVGEPQNAPMPYAWWSAVRKIPRSRSATCTPRTRPRTTPPAAPARRLYRREHLQQLPDRSSTSVRETPLRPECRLALPVGLARGPAHRARRSHRSRRGARRPRPAARAQGRAAGSRPACAAASVDRPHGTQQRQGDSSPCHSQLIAHWGACRKAPVTAHNRQPTPGPAGCRRTEHWGRARQEVRRSWRWRARPPRRDRSD